MKDEIKNIYPPPSPGIVTVLVQTIVTSLDYCNWCALTGNLSRKIYAGDDTEITEGNHILVKGTRKTNGDIK